ncbi:MAG: hypothetical protein NC313_16745 [Butyrivibrio sp.]|nr:hypothetical protein [Butyrivibrio sp.]
MVASAFMVGGMQSFVGGTLATAWTKGTGGLSLAGTNGVAITVTMLWEGMFAGGIAFATGTIASIASSAIIESVRGDMGLADDNSVKE